MASDFIVPEFLEDCDADTIHARMMDELPNDIDKTEGGFPWDFTRPTALIAAELLQFYIPEAIKLMFPQWSSGSFLDYLAAGSQTKRKASTYAEAVLTLTGEPAPQYRLALFLRQKPRTISRPLNLRQLKAAY